MIISFSGLDGCGKSTIIKRIIPILEAKSDKKNEVEVVWTRVGYTPGMNYLKGFARKLAGKKLPSAGRSSERTKAFQRPSVQRLWISIALLELIYIFSIKLRFKSYSSHILLDRQIDDSIIDLKILFGEVVMSSMYYKFLIFILKKTSVRYSKVGLTIDLGTSDYRCSIKYEPFPDTKEEKVIRFGFYEELFKKDRGFLLLDGLEKLELNVNSINVSYIE